MARTYTRAHFEVGDIIMSDCDEPVAILEYDPLKGQYKFQRLNNRQIEVNGLYGLYGERSLAGFYKIGVHTAIKALF